MAYIGKSPVIGNFVKLDAITAVNGQAAYTMQNGGSNFTDYESVNQFLVSLNGTIQAPTDSFTVSGSTLTFASNLSTGDVIDFIMVFGNSLSAGTPTDATVTAAKLNTTAVTGQTAETTVADDDTVLIHDTSASALRKMTVANLTANAGTAGITSSGGNITITNGNLVLGTADKGIDFSANSALSDGDATLSNELFDDYEEGTWTASVSAASGSITVNTSNDECHYTKIGNRIFLSGSIGISSVSSPSGRLTINNKPFDTSGGEGGKRGVLTVCFHNPASDEGSGIVGMIFESYSPIRLHNSSSGGEINANKMQSSSEIRFTGFYE